MTNPDQPDERLRDLLRSADPALSLEALEHDRITRMVNLTTSTSTATSTVGRPRRRPLLLGLAGVGGIAAAAFAAVSVLSPAAQAATRVSLPAGDGGLAAGSCPVLSPDSLAPLPLAFEGEVSSVTETMVTLQVTQTFRGSPAKLVEIERPALSAGDFSAFEFAPGQEYLIAVNPAASGGLPEIALCGLSGPASPQLRAVYDEAFR